MKSFLDILEEEKKTEKHHAMTFGRMNPPTTGHLKLIDKVKDVAKHHNASHSVVVSHTQDSKKNPLSSEQKLKHLKRYSHDTHFHAANKEHPTILHHAAELHKRGVTHLHVVVGSDRVKEMHHLLHKYNGHEASHGKYHFKKITVHSAGHRDPDAEGTEGMSGTKMREHAKNKDLHSFKKGVPGHVPEHHAKELMHDVRKGMGLHESTDRGQFRAIFVTGGPGSGKDIVIREAIADSRIVELNFIQARDYLADKQKLSEKSNDYRREAVRSRGPLIINGPADDLNKINYIKEELEELGYETMMIFVNTTNEVSKERNTLLSRMMMESVRQERWLTAQENTKYFTEAFNNFITFDNTDKIDTKEEDIHDVYESTKIFLDSKVMNETVEDWMERNTKFNINDRINSLLKEEKNVKSTNKFIQKVRNSRADSPADITADNRANDPAGDNIKWDGTKKTGGYTFRTYEEKDYKESNFRKDKEKIKKEKSASSSDNTIKADGISSEWNTRTNGSGLTGGAGLGNQTYSETIDYSNENPASTAMPSGGSPNPLSGDYNKDFKKFRKAIKKEAIDDPGAVDMGVSGTAGGAGNKEGMDTYKDTNRNITTIINKKKKK
jgi:predicted kinase